MWMRILPGECSLLCVEEPVDDDRIPLSWGTPYRPCGFALDHVRPGVCSGALTVAKENFAAIGNLLWIYSTVVLA